MTTTTEAPRLTCIIEAYEDAVLPTAADLRQMADYLDLVGQTVRIESPEGPQTIGTLTAVYWSDNSVAVNVTGLVDWSKEGKDYGPDFSCGPLYGATVKAVRDPWVAYNAGGFITQVFASQAEADVALANRGSVASISPWRGAST